MKPKNRKAQTAAMNNSMLGRAVSKFHNKVAVPAWNALKSARQQELTAPDNSIYEKYIKPNLSKVGTRRRKR